MDRTSSSDAVPRAATRSLSKGPAKAKFERIFSQGKRVNGSFARVSSLPGTGLLGFATSRKFGGKPQRNRQRRRFRAGIAGCSNLVLPSLDYVVILGPGCANVSFERINEEARDLLARSNARWEDDSESF